MEGTFRLDAISKVVLVVFGEYCLSLRAIISIIKRDNRLLDGCFGMLKRLFICILSFIFNSNAKFWPKDWLKDLTFLKKFSHALWRHHYVTKRNFEVCFFKNLKFNQISIEWWAGINFILNGLGVRASQKCLILVVGRESRERESGTVTFIHVCYSALAESSSGRFCSLWNFLRVLCAIVGWCFLLMNVPMKIRGPCQGPDIKKLKSFAVI